MSVKDALLRKPNLELAVQQAEQNLGLAAAYLAGRGITKEAAEKHRLGVFSDPPRDFTQFTGRLSIPYLTVTGPISVKARCLRDHNCKEAECVRYLAEADTAPMLYNATDLLRDDDVLYVVEGELDAVIGSGVLGYATISYPGTGNWRQYFTKAVGPDWGQVYVVADGDDAGRDAAKAVAKHLRGRVLRLPGGHDLSSFYKERGADASREFLSAG